MRKSANNNGIAFGPRILPQRTLGMAAVWLAAGLPFGSAVTALEPVAVLAPSDVPPGWTNGFGWSVAISGRYVAVGAPRDPWFNGDATGAVYVFRRQGARWIEQAKLTASDPQWPAQLGWSVAMEGDVIVAGAPEWDFVACPGQRAGAAYVFRRHDSGTPELPSDDTWTEETKLVVPTIYAANAFGRSVAISGDVIVLGTECGAAAIFRRQGTTWNHELSLVGGYQFGQFGGYLFGHAVSVAGDLVGVTAPGWPYSCPEFGQCYGIAVLFRHIGGQWLEEAILFGSEVNGFGASISVHGDRAAVGGLGRVYVFRPNLPLPWRTEQILVPSDPFASGFGKTVAIIDDALVSGSPSDYPSENRGSAFVFRQTQGAWVKTNKLAVDGIGPGSALGKSVALSGDYAAVGQWHGAYVYRICEGCGSLAEIAQLQNCFGENIGTGRQACQRFDVSLDGIVSLDDLGELMLLWVGP